MSEAFLKLVNMSISAGWLVLAVLALRLILKKAPKWVHVLLWGIVALRLICPFTIESALSLIPSTQTISPEIMMDWTPEISTGIESLDQMVNPVISTSFAPEPFASANPLQILIPVAANLWLLGVLVMLSYTAVSYISLRRKLRTAVIFDSNIFQCETVHSPFVLGVFRPRIYLPYTIEGQNLHHVVAHEQAHIHRKDHWWKPLGFLLLTVYWFNPLMWVAYIFLCRDIELACDEKVIAELGSDQRADYTQALVACSVNRRKIAACPMAFGEVGVKERVKSIMNYCKPAFWILVLAIIACIVVAVCFLTDPVDPAEDTDGMQMHQDSFLYATEDGYYLLIGADGVQEIQVSLPDSGGGVVNADGSSFKKGEKVWLEHLQNVTDLRGLSITALGKTGEIRYALSIPEDASMEDVINTVGGDGWLLAPTAHIIGPTMDELTDQLHALQKLEAEQESSSAKSAYQNPPGLTVSYGEEKMREPRIGLLSWEYIGEDGTKVALDGDGAHPLDEKQSSPSFVLDPYADVAFMICLKWDLKPDSVLVRYWDESCWGQLEAEPVGRELLNETDDGYCFIPTRGNYIYEVIATWEDDPNYSGRICYNFHTVMTDRKPTAQELYDEYASMHTKGAHIYVDLNEDGVEELFIYRSGRTSEIVTISEGKAVTVMASNHLFLCDGGIIGRYSEGAGGCTVFYYKMDDNEAVTLVDVIMTTYHDDAWYRSTDPNLQYATAQNMTRITKEEAQKVSEQYAISEDNVPQKPDYLTWLYGEEYPQ